MRYWTILLLVLATPSWADITGKVVRVVDGDTVVVGDHRIRLTGIDAPETIQAHGKEASEYLRGLIRGKTVIVVSSKKDRYGRILGKIILGGIDVNLVMVKEGHAWWYSRYQKDQSGSDRRAYRMAEETARAAEIGLWSSTAIPPWEYRRQ